MPSFLSLRYLSDNHEAGAKKELGTDDPTLVAGDRRTLLAAWYGADADDAAAIENLMRCRVH